MGSDILLVYLTKNKFHLFFHLHYSKQQQSMLEFNPKLLRFAPFQFLPIYPRLFVMSRKQKTPILPMKSKWIRDVKWKSEMRGPISYYHSQKTLFKIETLELLKNFALFLFTNIFVFFNWQGPRNFNSKCSAVLLPLC